MMAFAAVLSSVCSVGVGGALAQDLQDPEVADGAGFTSNRPGFANGSAIAAHARLTLETGVVVIVEDDVAIQLPTLQLRTGLFDWLELFVGAPNLFLVPNASPVAGVGDAAVGFKVAGAPSERVSVSHVFSVTLPTGTDTYRAPDASVRLDLNVDVRIAGPIVLTPNLVASVLSVIDPTTMESRHLAEGGGSLKLTVELPDILSLYIQSVALVRETEQVRVSLGGGIYARVLPTVQLDASLDAGITEGGDPISFGVGSTVLF